MTIHRISLMACLVLIGMVLVWFPPVKRRAPIVSQPKNWVVITSNEWTHVIISFGSNTIRTLE